MSNKKLKKRYSLDTFHFIDSYVFGVFSKVMNSNKIKTAIFRVFQYLGFFVFALLAITNITLSIEGALFYGIAAALCLPQIQKRFPFEFLKKSYVIFLLIIFSLFFGMEAVSDANREDFIVKNEKIRQAREARKKEKQENLLKSFESDKEKILADLKSIEEAGNWQSLKAKTEVLIITEDPEIISLNKKALSELALEKEKEAKRQAALEAERKKKAAAELWNYFQNDDLMSKGKTYYATISSSNSVQFGFPYSGKQKGRLVFRTDPKHGKDVMFSIERGQILCPSYDGCKVLVRFDEENASTYKANPPSDNSSETIFIQNYSQFIGKLMKSDRVRLSMDIYQEGSPVFEFDISGFDVDKYLPNK